MNGSERLRQNVPETICLTQDMFIETIGLLPELQEWYANIIGYSCPANYWSASYREIAHIPWPIAGPLSVEAANVHNRNGLSLPLHSGITQYLPEKTKTVSGLLCLSETQFNRFRGTAQRKIIDTVKHLAWYLSINLGYGLFIADVFDSCPCPVSPYTAQLMREDIDRLFNFVKAQQPDHHTHNRAAWDCYFRAYYGIGSFDINTHLKIQSAYQKIADIGIIAENQTSFTSDMIGVQLGPFIRQIARFRGMSFVNYIAYGSDSFGHFLFGDKCIADTRLSYPMVDPNRRLVDLIGPLAADIRLCGTCPGMPVHDVYDLLMHFDINAYYGDRNGFIESVRRTFGLIEASG